LGEEHGKLVYHPWSSKVLKELINTYRRCELPVLDLEFSAACTLRKIFGGCIYCDSEVGSPHNNELNAHEVMMLIDRCLALGLKWIYVCGLGEPTNDPKFYDVIEKLEAANVKMSIFTNGIYLTRDLIEKLYESNVSIIIKCDSFNEKRFNHILMGKLTTTFNPARKIYENIRHALEVGYCEKSGPDMALSVVITRINIDDIPHIVEFCKNNAIFPLIAELEYAGRAKRIYSELAPSVHELLELKQKVDEILGYEYVVPICPAALVGLHITNVGECVIDRRTGMSCGWFYLKEPDYVSLGNVRHHDVKHLLYAQLEYRSGITPDALIDWWRDVRARLVFGGCGGMGIMDSYINILHLSSEKLKFLAGA